MPNVVTADVPAPMLITNDALVAVTANVPGPDTPRLTLELPVTLFKLTRVPAELLKMLNVWPAPMFWMTDVPADVAVKPLIVWLVVLARSTMWLP